MKSIGLLGGTFNPIHYGHLRLAQEVADALGLDQVRVIPSAHPPHRPPPAASSEQRAAMVSLAIADNPLLMLDAREVQRAGYSYTIDTLISLRQELGDQVGLYWLLGNDAFLGLPGWHRWQELLDYCHLIVANRPGSQSSSKSNVDIPDDLQTLLNERETHEPDALSRQPHGLIYRQVITALDISATHIRALIAQGLSPRYLLSQPIDEFIQQHGLYSGQ